MPNSIYVKKLSQVNLDETDIVGEKAAKLGELAKNGFLIPGGFVITFSAYEEFIEQNGLKKTLCDIWKKANKNNVAEVHSAKLKISKLFSKANLAGLLRKEILSAYYSLGSLFKDARVIIRPSLKKDTVLNNYELLSKSTIHFMGDANLLQEIINIWSSNPSAIIVQVVLDTNVSGTAFTTIPGIQNTHKMLIEAVWGLPNIVYQASFTPDQYILERHSLEIIKISKSDQFEQFELGRSEVKSVKTPSHRTGKRKLSDEELITLAKVLQRIQQYYYYPQVVEWGCFKKKFYILHVRESTDVLDNKKSISKNEIDTSSKVSFLKGVSVFQGIAKGVVRIINSNKDLNKISRSEILVFEKITPDLFGAIAKSAGIITESGGVTSHASILATELGIPTIVGVDKARNILKNGQVVTIDGTAGKVYIGSKPVIFSLGKSIEIHSNEKLTTATKIYLNIAGAVELKKVLELPSDGVGLLRSEFLLSEIGIHPKHLILQGKADFFIESMIKKIEPILKKFNPSPVMYRTFDFKSNEYRNLKYGKDFEQVEENPLLGFRGSARYIAEPQVFELELKVIRVLRETYKNLHLILPFVRAPEELLEVKRIMASSGLIRNHSFLVWMMVETPANVILIEDFLDKGIDGISFGTNDLDSLIYGYDRDNPELSKNYFGLTPALNYAFKRVISACKKRKITTSICGEVASSYDTLIERLVSLGIDSVSVNPDAYLRVQKVIYDKERSI